MNRTQASRETSQGVLAVAARKRFMLVNFREKRSGSVVHQGDRKF